MAAIQAHSLPSDFGALRSDNKSQLTTCTPYSSPVKQRGSSCYLPQRGTQVLEESNTDPFYLEQTLRDSCKPGQRDVHCCETTDHQCFTLSSVNKRKEHPYPNPVRREPAGPQSNIDDNAKGNRNTLSVVELEHRIGLQEIAAQRGLERQHAHCKQSSVSSSTSEATPNLTPSSSFSSNYSLVRDQHLSFEPQRITSESGSHLYLTPCTPPPPPIRPPPPTTLHSLPSTPRPHQTPTRNSKGTARPVNDSTETLTMQNEDPQVRYNRLGKPLPTLPNIARNGQKAKSAQNGTHRSQIEPSMISPPSLINPVTMEPHTTHFDQALFIPANDCPSPVPSPGRNSTSSRLAREVTNTSPSREKERPWTARSEAYCEQSVWESDSDSESIGPKSLSKKPIDTLRKVRSRVHLRVARSAPRLNGAPPLPPPVPSPPTDGAPLEKFPSMPDHPVQQPPHPPPPPPPPLPPGSSGTTKKPTLQTRSSKDIVRPNAQTLRLVAPSTTSLVRPDSRNDKEKSLPATPTTATTKTSEHDMDSAAAAAFQAQSRRRQRSRSPTSPAATGYADKEKLRTLCREERTEHTLHSSLTLGRRPLYRRFWESLRILSCHSDMAPKPTRKSF